MIKTQATWSKTIRDSVTEFCYQTIPLGQEHRSIRITRKLANISRITHSNTERKHSAILQDCSDVLASFPDSPLAWYTKDYFFRKVILVLLASTGNNVWASDKCIYFQTPLSYWDFSIDAMPKDPFISPSVFVMVAALSTLGCGWTWTKVIVSIIRLYILSFLAVLSHSLT